MIDFEPLFKTLEEKGIKLIELEKALSLSPRTTAKFRKNESMNLDTVNKICTYLQVPIEKVVRINYDEKEIK